MMSPRFVKSKVTLGLAIAAGLGVYFYNSWQDYLFVKKPVTPIAELAQLPVGSEVRVQGRVVGDALYSTLFGPKSCAIAQSEIFLRRMRERNRVDVKFSSGQPVDGFLLQDDSGAGAMRIKIRRDPHTVWVTRTETEINGFQPGALAPDQRRALDYENTEGHQSLANLGLYYLVEHCLTSGAQLTVDGRVERVDGHPILVNATHGYSVVTDLPPDQVLLTVQRYDGRMIPMYTRWAVNLAIFLTAVGLVVFLGRRWRPRVDA